MSYTELFCRSGGSNLNGGGVAAGTEPGTAAAYTATNGNWDGTSAYIPTDGSTPASSVAVGDFASVYIDGATVPVYYARVTVVAAGVNGQITLSTTAIAGTAPTSSATARSIKIGGAWKGPNAGVGQPFDLITSALTDAAGDQPRVNMKNDATYSITTGIAHSKNGVRFEGYTTTAGDGGRAIIDGTGANILLLTHTGSSNSFINLVLQNNATGTNGAYTSNGNSLLRGVIATGVRGSGFNLSNGDVAIECEAYACNAATAGSRAGFRAGGSAILIRCISHDNSAASTDGFVVPNSQGVNVTFINCISDTNSGNGFTLNANKQYHVMIGCDSYNNTGDGIQIAGATNPSDVVIESSNLVKNGGWGINASAVIGGSQYRIQNNGFGAGTQTNTSGQTTGLPGSGAVASVTYANDVTPWVDPANGDFRVNLATAKGAGRGAFTQTAASYAGAVGFPDIGAAQHQDAGGGHIASRQTLGM